MHQIRNRKEIEKLQTFDLRYFLSKSHFADDGAQSYLLFNQYFKTPTNSDKVIGWKSKGLSGDSVKPLATSDDSLNPRLDYTDNAKIEVKFDGSNLNQGKVTFSQNAILNFYVVYEMNLWSLNLDSTFALLIFLFSAVTLTESADLDKYS